LCAATKVESTIQQIKRGSRICRLELPKNNSGILGIGLRWILKQKVTEKTERFVVACWSGSAEEVVGLIQTEQNKPARQVLEATK
jgi:hypothetical protein